MAQGATVGGGGLATLQATWQQAPNGLHSAIAGAKAAAAAAAGGDPTAPSVDVGDISLLGPGLRSAFALLQVLVQTISALALGYLCVRYGAIDVQRGDMQAIQFFIGRIALPLLVFRIVATSSIGSVDLGVVAACSLGKVAVYILTFGMTFCAYRSKDPFGRRILTSAVFGFFTTASNDLAIGFPVINAIYGDDMAVYLAANVLVFQTLIQPLAMVMFEIGHALSQGSERPSGDDLRDQRRTMVLKLARSIALNPIMLATALGAVYSCCLSWTLVRDGANKMHLPEPIGGIIELWTSPFTMMFLFLNGTSLRSASIALWPAVLVLMKVVVCAYISYGLSHVFVNPDNPKAQALRDFTFFYGTIPAGGAPLIYSQLFDCGVEVIAASSILCLILAGPIEFMTALFLGTANAPVNYQDVRAVLHACAQASALCSGTFVLFMVLGWWGGSFASRAIGVFGVVTLIYELWTLLMMSSEAQCTAPGHGLFLYRFLQNVCYILVVYIEYHLGTRWHEGRRVRSHVVTLVVLAAALLVTYVVPAGNGGHEMCSLHLDKEPAMYLIAWNVALCLLICGLAVRGRLLKQRVGGLLPARLPKTNRRPSALSLPLLGAGPPPRLLEAGGAPTGGAASPDAATLHLVEDSPPAAVQRRRASEASSVASGSPRWDSSAEEGQGEQSTASQEALHGVGGDGVAVATCLVVLQGLRSVMGAINCSGQALTRDRDGNHQGFTPMLILEVILEHGQGCFLLLAVIFQPGVLAATGQLLRGMGASGCCQGYWQEAIVEVADHCSPVRQLRSPILAEFASLRGVPSFGGADSVKEALSVA